MESIFETSMKPNFQSSLCLWSVGSNHKVRSMKIFFVCDDSKCQLSHGPWLHIKQDYLGGHSEQIFSLGKLVMKSGAKSTEAKLYPT